MTVKICYFILKQNKFILSTDVQFLYIGIERFVCMHKKRVKSSDFTLFYMECLCALCETYFLVKSMMNLTSSIIPEMIPILSTSLLNVK